MPIKRAFYSKWFLLLGSTVLTLILLELILTFIGPKFLQKRRHQNSCRSFIWEETHTRFDPELGFMNEPNLKTRFENWEYETTVRTNSWGFRDDEESLKEPDILLLGDSFGFGWGVEREEMAERVLETKLGKKVLNMSVACYGTIQQFLLLQRYCEVENVTGCTVVFLYYINDRIENRAPPGESLPTLRKDGQKVVFTPADQATYDATLDIHRRTLVSDLSYYSAVLDLVCGTFFNQRRGALFSGYFEEERWEKKRDRYPGIPVGPFEVLEYLLRVLKLYAHERNLEIEFALIPFLELYEDVEDKENYDPEKEVFRRVRVPCHDLTEGFSERDFYRYDRHMNPSGHKKLALKIAALLEENETE